MNFYSKTVDEFFGTNKIQYSIPEYQRAYSWEELQIKTFLEDLIEHRHSDQNNPYCFGNILLEKIGDGKKYEVIDGQQRLTTITIFMRALLNTFSARIAIGKEFKISEDEKIVVSDEEDNYFKDHGVIKLRPTPYDQACYDTIIIENCDVFNCITPSQKRMLAAKRFFSEELNKLSDKDLLSVFKTVRCAIVNHIELTGKKESALMFELQNNRGKELTNLEKLKSFLMYQLYVYSHEDETVANIEYVSNQFNPIYNIINQMSLQLGIDDDDGASSAVSEDSILIYHSYAYSKKNFGYRNLNDIIEEFKSVANEDKVQWIKDYARTLYQSFSSIQAVFAMNDDYLEKLKRMKMPFFVYPFIIKGSKNKASLPKLFRIMEVLSFRYKLISSRADIRGRLSDLIRRYDGDNDRLALELKAKMDEAYYWGDRKFLEVLNGNMYQNNMIYYLLWEYEQELQRSGYIISGVRIENESIEHISPQTEPDETIASGYEIDSTGHYSKDFRENYINKLGNLMLISKSHNSSIGNNPFKDKLQSYVANPLLRQQSQIAEFVTDVSMPIWNSDSIDSRHKKMIDFALRRWSY